MMEIKTVSLFGGEITLYGILMILACLLAGAGLILLSGRKGIKRPSAAVYCLLAAALGLLLGRLIYCAVRFDRVFYDAMGDFMGFLPFFDVRVGSLNIGGVMLGCILAAPLAARIGKGKAAGYLDCAVFPGLSLFIAERLAEPLVGKGYGVYLYDASFAFYPLAMQTYMDEYALSVCFIEAVLAAALIFALTALAKKRLQTGQLFLCALTLFCACQIMPESLRHDDVLFIFIFARVTQICYALMLAGAQIAALARARRNGLGFRQAVTEFLLLLAGAGICIGAEFALDKTNLSHTLIYTVMIAVLAGMAALVLRRILRKEAAQ
ncbi:MAG: prolipoprotein diacylglyceryl transferase [Clostridia bacterium]|nr:prolipoprotein diacylglyceryl transferase [Clostridia bacterium]